MQSGMASLKQAGEHYAQNNCGGGEGVQMDDD